MKPIQENRILETGGMDSNVKTGFKIEAHPFAFDVMTKKLYSDPIRSIIRELACNAYDAGVMRDKVWESGGDTTYLAPKGSNFKVILPNTFEPMFTITDNGIGLSVDQITGLYTTLFGSTKRDSNDVIGAFGLGSKTPFSYTDQFVVISTFNGVKYTWNAFKSAQGMPEITLVHQTETTDKNGLSVSMSVKPSDYSTFAEKAKHVFAWFDTTPEIKGVSGFKPIEIAEDSDFTFKSCKFYKNGSGYSGLYVKQGMVAYPVRASNFTSGLLKSHHNEILRQNVLIEVPIGAVSVTPSREELTMDSHTEFALISYMDKIVDEIGDTVAKKFSTITSLHEGRVLWGKIFNNHTNSLGFLTSKVVGTKYAIKDGRMVSKDTVALVPEILKDEQVTIETVDPITGNKLVRQGLRKMPLYVTKKVFLYSGLGEKLAVDNMKYQVHLSPNDNMQVIVVDQAENISSVKFRRKLRHYLTTRPDNSSGYHYLVILCDKTFTRKECEDALTAQLNEFPHVVPFSSLPEPPKVLPKTKAVPTPIKKVLKFNHNQHKNSTFNSTFDLWNETDHDVTTGGIYVFTEKRIPEGFSSWNAFKEHIQDLRKHKLLDENVPLFGIQQVGKKIPVDNKGWVTLEDHVKQEITKSKMLLLYTHKKQDIPREYFNLARGLSSYAGKNKNVYDFIKGSISVRALNDEAANYDVYGAARILAKYDMLPKVIPPHTIEGQLKALYKEYPLLYPMCDSNIKEWTYLHYIQLVDDQKQKGNK